MERVPDVIIVVDQTLEMTFATVGARSYIAFSGGINTTPWLGSRSTFHKAGVGGIDGKAIQLLKLKLIKKVSLITPNIPETEILTKTTIITKEDMIFAANKLIGLGAKNVLIKGGHLKHKNVLDILINKKDIKIFKSERHKTKNTHGTGCTLSSSVTTFLSCGKTVKKSCELGIKYVNSAIKSNPKYGKGHGPINHLTSLKVNRKFK